MRGNLRTPLPTVKGLRPMTFSPSSRPLGCAVRSEGERRASRGLAPAGSRRGSATAAISLVLAFVAGPAAGEPGRTGDQPSPTFSGAGVARAAEAATVPMTGAPTARAVDPPGHPGDLAAWLDHIGRPLGTHESGRRLCRHFALLGLVEVA